jgi:hypothetical protein
MFVACDESGMSDRYWVIGSVWLPAQMLSTIEKEITELRLSKKCWGEVKWEKVSDQFLDFYKSFLTIVFSKNPHFHCIVIDSQLLTAEKIKQFHKKGGQREAFFKFYRLLLGYCIKKYMTDGEKNFHIVYDSTNDTQELRRVFHDFVRLDARDCIQHIAPCTSHINSLVQFSDILSGAVASKVNNKGLASARSNLIEQIEQWSGSELNLVTSAGKTPFSHWRWFPRS